MSQFQAISSENGLLKNHKIHLNAPSSFIPIEEVIANDPKDDTIAELFDELYAQDGEIDHLLQIMSFQPKFLKDFLHFYNYLMYSQGALSYDTRHYISILAAARHKCFYLIKKQEKEFLAHNGNLQWLNGIDFIPQKIKDLYEINKLLAHQPWLLNHNHIEKILRGPNSWLVAELIMAITILTHFHALSGFVYGCGINEKYVHIFQQQLQNNAFVAISAYDVENYNINNNHVYFKDENLIKNASNSPIRSNDIQNRAKNDVDDDESLLTDNNNKTFFKNKNSTTTTATTTTTSHGGNSGSSGNSTGGVLIINSSSTSTTSNTISTSPSITSTTLTPTTTAPITILSSSSTSSKTFDTMNNSNQCKLNESKLLLNDLSTSINSIQIANNYISKYIYDPEYTHQNFKYADQTLKLEHQYTWEHNGYMTGCSLYPEISNLLDQTFKTAYNMNYNTPSVYKGVDASLFRRAVWLYIHSIFGIFYDDYDYNKIKTLLTLPLRTFIKTICSCPERITKKDYDTFAKEFSHSEKVHINIVIMEARMQASMLYFFRAIAEYYCIFQ